MSDLIPSNESIDIGKEKFDKKWTMFYFGRESFYRLSPRYVMNDLITFYNSRPFKNDLPKVQVPYLVWNGHLEFKFKEIEEKVNKLINKFFQENVSLP